MTAPKGCFKQERSGFAVIFAWHSYQIVFGAENGLYVCDRSIKKEGSFLYGFE